MDGWAHCSPGATGAAHIDCICQGSVVCCREQLGSLEEILQQYHCTWLDDVPMQMWALISSASDCHHRARAEVFVSHLDPLL